MQSEGQPGLYNVDGEKQTDKETETMIPEIGLLTYFALLFPSYLLLHISDFL